MLKNGDRDGELERARLEKGMRSARHGTIRQGLRASRVRSGRDLLDVPHWVRMYVEYVACVSGHGLNAMRCGVIQ